MNEKTSSSEVRTMRPRSAGPAPLTPTGFGEMSVDEVVARKEKIREIMKRVMVEGVHYGIIPGTQKPTLLKPGTEILCTTFALAPDFTIEQTDLPNGHREYRVVSRLTHIPTGAVVGEGVGCCSTMETKYRYRGVGRKCPSCGKPTIIRSKYAPRGQSEDAPKGWYCYAAKGGCGKQFAPDAREILDQSDEKIENPDLADSYNTVLKMGKKRGQSDAVLTALGASDVFEQDREDEEDHDDRPVRRETQQRQGPAARGTQDAEAAQRRGRALERLVEIRKQDPEAFLFGLGEPAVPQGTPIEEIRKVAAAFDFSGIDESTLRGAIADAEEFMRENPPEAGTKGPSPTDVAHDELVRRFEAVREKNPPAAMEAIEARTPADLDAFDPAKLPVAKLKPIVDRAEKLLDPAAGSDYVPPRADEQPRRRPSGRR